MVENNGDKGKLLRSVLVAARLGFVAGVLIVILTWIATGILKVLVTWPTLVWPDWFPSAVPEFILSGLWAAIVIVLTTVIGVIVGWLWPARYEVL